MKALAKPVMKPLMKQCMAAMLLAVAAAVAWAAPPVITSLEPRGAQKGRPFKVTFYGRDIPDGAKVWSTLPAHFTLLAPAAEPGSMMMAGRAVSFLVEPKGEVAPGSYPVRLETPAGLSNILFFTIGAFSEITEAESLPGSPEHRNDSIETAETISTAPITVNGTLKGAERDVYRVFGKGTERRLFEVEARRIGSAIDPVLRILDAKGRQLARMEDTPGLNLDPRLEFTFPAEGYYYVEVHDARFSRQEQNYYRLRMGLEPFAAEIFPVGGRRGEKVTVEFSGGNLAAPVKTDVDLRGIPEHSTFTYVSLPGSTAIPYVFVVNDVPDLREPAAGPLRPPFAMNGRLSKPGEIDRFKLQVEPGEDLLIELLGREAGTSRISAVVTVWDAKGKRLASTGDEPLPVDVFQVAGSARTSRDPFLNFKVPKDAAEITVSVEDLAERGGPGFPYRLLVKRVAEDFELTVVTPYVNVPSGGTAVVTVAADRKGFNGPIHLSASGLPDGVTFEGGRVPEEHVDAANTRTFNRRGMVFLTASKEFSPGEIEIWGEGRLADGKVIRKRARGAGLVMPVAGATAQGVVDRQRPITAPQLGLLLPAGLTGAPPATLEISQVSRKRLEEGDEYVFRWKWNTRAADLRPPKNLNVDPVGVNDIRITDMKTDPKDPLSGTFLVTTTKSTWPGQFDLLVSGRIDNEDIYARPIVFEVVERKESKSDEVSTSATTGR